MSTIYETRRAIFKSKLEVDIAFITSPANIFYYTGFLSNPHERFMALVFNMKTNEEILYVPALDLAAAEQVAHLQRIVPISDEQIPFEVVKNTIGNLAQTAGVEAKALTLSRYLELIGALNVQVTDIQQLINTQRLHKTRDEINQLKVAIHIIEQVMSEGIKKIHIGMTELELVAELEYLMRKFGADGQSFASIILSGENAALPHGHPSMRKIEHGDFVLIDMGVVKDGYCSDITRTFIVGEATDKQREIYDTVLASTLAGIKAAKANIPLKQVDLTARAVIENKGYGDYFNNRVGHGLGIEVHEEPSVHAANNDLITKGMVFTIEPGIYIPNYGGVRIEDNVYINEHGEAEVLTTFPRELQIL